MNGGPSCFHNAPIIRSFVIASALLTVVLGLQGRSQRLGLSYKLGPKLIKAHSWMHAWGSRKLTARHPARDLRRQLLRVRACTSRVRTEGFSMAPALAKRFDLLDILGEYEIELQDIFAKVRLWGLIASVFAFSSTPELMFGLYLLYYFRVFERQIGSNMHSLFILFSVIVSSLFEVLALMYLKDPSNMLASGPYCLIFASFVPFYFDIPISSRFRIFGVQFTDKSFIYVAGLQLLFSSWKRSLIPGMCGVLAGSLYRLNLLGIRKKKFPDAIESVLSRLSWPSSSTSSHTSSGGNTSGLLPAYAGRQMEGTHPSTPALRSDTSVATLVSMGFDSNSARQALIHAGNDINVATNILLESQLR